MSEYKDIAKILIEGPFADDEKQDAGADRVGRDDGDTWQAPNGDIGGKSWYTSSRFLNTHILLVFLSSLELLYS